MIVPTANDESGVFARFHGFRGRQDEICQEGLHAYTTLARALAREQPLLNGQLR